MITVIEDISGLIKEDEYIYLNEYSEYVGLYKLIQKAIKNHSNLTIVVKISVVITWFEKLAHRYEDHIFNFKKITYKTNLQSVWGINIPAQYSPDELEELDLVNIDIHPKQNDNFEDFILTYYFDQVFSNHSFTSGLIVQLIKSYDKQKWDKNLESNLLRKIYQERITEWQNKIREDYLSAVLNDILNDSEKVAAELMLYKVLRTKIYHEIGKLVFRDRFEHLQRLKLNLKDIEIDYNKIDQALNQIEIHLNTLSQPTNQIELEVLISFLSGLIPGEYYHIEKILRENPQLINSTIVNQIKTVFTPIYSKIGKKIEKLNDLIVPDKPTVVEIDSEVDFVKKWLVNKYLPYQNWLLKNNLYEEDFVDIGDSFSDWFYTNWEDIKANSVSLVSNWLYKNSSSFENQNKINVVLIVDNLCYSHSKLIQDLFADNDINMISSEPYFSMVPSETETSKKCLLSGKSSYIEIDQRSYTDILNKGWIPYFNSASFIYVSSLDRFEETSIEKSKSYFVNYHSIDIALHQEQAKLGTTHEKQINHLLTELVSRVMEILEDKNIIEQTIIHIISDHGSAKIHPNTKNDLDVKSYKKKSTIKTTERYVILSDEDYSNLPDNLKHDCFFIDKNRFGLLNHCLCARRGNTFKDYSFNSYLHGGLLPEEVVVPHLIFEKIEVKIEAPIVNLLRNKFRYKAEEIELQVENPNTIPLENIKIKILNSNVEALTKFIDWLNSKTKEVIKIQSRFKKSLLKEETDYLIFNISFLVNKKPFEYDYKLDILMVSMVELKHTTDFDI